MRIFLTNSALIPLFHFMICGGARRTCRGIGEIHDERLGWIPGATLHGRPALELHASMARKASGYQSSTTLGSEDCSSLLRTNFLLDILQPMVCFSAMI
jgi:hypothetical protein